MTRANKPNYTRDEQIRKKASQGATAADLAAEYSLSTSRIEAITAGVKNPNKRQRNARITREMMLQAKECGWNPNKAATKFGYHAKTIRTACKRFGISLPYGKGEATGYTKESEIAAASTYRVKAWSASPAARKKFFDTYGDGLGAVARYQATREARA